MKKFYFHNEMYSSMFTFTCAQPSWLIYYVLAAVNFIFFALLFLYCRLCQYRLLDTQCIKCTLINTGIDFLAAKQQEQEKENKTGGYAGRCKVFI